MRRVYVTEMTYIRIKEFAELYRIPMYFVVSMALECYKNKRKK